MTFPDAYTDFALDPMVRMDMSGCVIVGANRIAGKLLKKITRNGLQEGRIFCDVVNAPHAYLLDHCPFEQTYATIEAEKTKNKKKTMVPGIAAVDGHADRHAQSPSRRYRLFWFQASPAPDAAARNQVRGIDYRLLPLLAGAPVAAFIVDSKSSADGFRLLARTPSSVTVNIPALSFREPVRRSKLEVDKPKHFYFHVLAELEKGARLDQAWDEGAAKFPKIAERAPKAVVDVCTKKSTSASIRKAKKELTHLWEHALDAAALVHLMPKILNRVAESPKLRYVSPAANGFELRYLRNYEWAPAMGKLPRRNVAAAPKNGASKNDAVALVRSWQADKSGYDRRTWPELARILAENRSFLGSRQDG